MKHRHIRARHDEYVHVHRDAAPASSSSSQFDWSKLVLVVLGILFVLYLLSLIPGWVWLLIIIGAAFGRSK